MREAMATQDFVTLDKVCRDILAVKIPAEDEKSMRDALEKFNKDQADPDKKALNFSNVENTFRAVFKDKTDELSWILFEKAANERNAEKIED